MSEVKQGHPKGLYVLFVTEMWERFSYYGMRAIFILYLTKALLYDKAFASDGLYGSYTSLVYLTPLLGGYIADRYWGNRKSIIFGGILMALGQFLMFISGSLYESTEISRLIMFSGLAFLIFGNGFFKPNISTMVGQLYPEGDKRVDSAFTIFYMGINLGAFFAPLVCGFLGDTDNPADFKWGFLAACIGMILSLIIFISLKDKYIVTPDGKAIGGKPEIKKIEPSATAVKPGFTSTTILTWAGVLVILFCALFFLLNLDFFGSLIYSLCIAVPGLIISDGTLTKIEKQRIWVIYIIAFFVIFFWMAFEQAGASLTFFADQQTDRTLSGGAKIPASFFQSINALAIVAFAPIFTILWRLLNKRKKEPASPVKQALGLMLLAVGYLVIAMGVKGISPDAKVSMFWLVGLYTIHTLGELCLSPIGLSMVVKLSPVKFASLLMGVWFMSTATANKLAGTLSALYPEDVKKVATFEVKDNISMLTTNENNNVIQVISEKDSAQVLRLDTTEYKIKKVLINTNVNTAPLHPTKEIDPFKIRLSLFSEEAKNVYNFKKNIVEENRDKFVDVTVAFDKKNKLKSTEGNIVKLYTTKDSRYLAIFKSSIAGANQYKDHTVEIWDTKPKKPNFAGIQIDNLYDFFMIFVGLAGAAAVILLLISGKLLKMMNGVR